MSVDYKAKLLVGLELGELGDFLDPEIDIEDYGLDYASPYYDADRDDWVVGVKVASTYDYSSTEVDLTGLQAAFDRFKEITGMEGKLILSPHGH